MYQSTHTGAQVDEAVDKALSADAVPTPSSTNLVQSGGVYSVLSNRNLLDNAWFRVNQRGATSGTQIAYIADRWTATYGSGGVTWSRTDDTITVQSTSGSSNAYVSQKMEPDLFDALNGKTVTVSVMLNDHSIIHNTVTWSSSSQVSAIIGKGLDNNNVRIETAVATKAFSIRKTNTAETFRAFKLELGPVSTLANDAPPNFAEELAKCQRYYWDAGYSTTKPGIFSSLASSTSGSFSVYIPTPVSMRLATPTISAAVSWVRGEGSNITGYSLNTTNAAIVSGAVFGISLDKSGGYAALKPYYVAFSKLTVSCDL